MSPGRPRLLPPLILLGAVLACAGTPPPSTRGIEATVVYTTARPRPPETYAGSNACRDCHAAIYDFWQGTAHARSLGTLRAMGKGSESSCLRCHATGFGLTSGYDGRAGMGLDAVGCEACHGPSAGHAARPKEVPVTGPVRKDCYPCILNEVCRLCHTPKWSNKFSPDRYFDRVRCPRN